MDEMRRTQLNNDDLKYEFPNLPANDLLRELILYISDQCEEDKGFGLTKLNKILYFADFMSYARYGEPITGVSYIKLPKGPVPQPMLAVRKQMEADLEILIRLRDYHGYPQHRVIALREANLEKFKPRDIALIDSVIRKLADETAAEVSARSHGRAWRAVRNHERIPYNAVFISDEGITEEDRALTAELFPQYSEQIC
jgi:hypothetical protein